MIPSKVRRFVRTNKRWIKWEDGEEHPSITAMELLKYGAATFGNHEFNYGLDFLDEVKDDAIFPYVNANVRDAKTGYLKYDPFIMIDVVDSKRRNLRFKSV